MSQHRNTVVILGSTGSIGTQGLDVISRHPERFTVTGLAAGGAHVRLLAQQVARHHVPQVAVYDEAAVPALHEALEEVGARYTQIQAGPQAVNAIAGSGADLVLNGITGSVGLEPSIAALRAGSQLALANKESVVAGGHLLFGAQVRDDQINPVDSEHSAIWQSLRSGTHAEVSRLVVTASGGPFRGWKRADMSDITPEQALNHPTWHMGPVVTINSSTLMNKGLEVIEASRLFDVSPDRIVVTVHPQSIVHSMVEFVDGATVCQASPPDMRLPIALGLSAPDRLGDVAAACDWTHASEWTFEPLHARGWTRRRAGGRSSRWTTRRSPPSRWRASAYARRRSIPRCSTQRTSRPCMPSSTIDCPIWASSTRSRRSSTRWTWSFAATRCSHPWRKWVKSSVRRAGEPMI